MHSVDTIAAVATAPGRGGVGVVRVSGPQTRSIAKTITGKTLRPRYAELCNFRGGDGVVLDQGIALFFENPKSFTGEDVLELQGHGGPIVLSMVLARVLELGGRQANPGEFTERSFLNGKLDLTQAEAVLDLVNSASRQAAKGAMRSLSGAFSRRVTEIDHELLELRVFCEGAIDFPEDDVDFFSESNFADRLESVRAKVATLTTEARQGEILSDGLTLVLIGEPNVGKSSVLNRLSGQDRAIVTAEPGTTRDTLSAEFELDGLPVRVVDTAGLRESTDPVEVEGVDRARRAMSSADAIIWVIDDQKDLAGQSPIVKNDPSAATMVVRNKVDLTKRSVGRLDKRTVRVSALTGQGFSELREALKGLVGYQAGEGTFTARRRHLDALAAASKALDTAAEGLAHGEGELVAEDLRVAHNHLGAIVGQVSADDLLGEIFASFCIGK